MGKVNMEIWTNSAIWFPLALYAVSQVYKCDFETASLRMAISFYGAAARAPPPSDIG